MTKHLNLRMVNRTWDESERIDGRLVNGGQVLTSLGPCFRFTHNDPVCICVSSDLLTNDEDIPQSMSERVDLLTNDEICPSL